jgi:hypothetical protein
VIKENPDRPEAAAMASIGTVDLKIFPNVPVTGSALVQVDYVIEETLDDVTSGRTYRELVQLVKQDRELGRHGAEIPVVGGTMSDASVMFTGSDEGYQRGWELTLPLSELESGVSPLQNPPIRARVSLTPLPPTGPTRESNTVELGVPVGTES